MQFWVGQCVCGEHLRYFRDMYPLPWEIQAMNMFCKIHICVTLSERGYFGNENAHSWNFPGNLVVRNLPCNARHLGSIPGQGTEIPHALEQQSLHAATAELTCQD